MLRFDDGLVVEVSAAIDAPPQKVWEAITDINLPARFQDEFQGAEWIDEGPALGASFRGRNRRGDRQWETTSWVTAFEPVRTFGWSVSDRDNPGATWTFHLEPAGDGTVLRYHRLLGPGPSGVTRRIEAHPDREHDILEARNEEHRRHMQAVVDGVKETVEGA